jgi:hypothetical protein
LPWLPALGVLLLLGSKLVVLLVVGMAVAVGPFYIPTGIRYRWHEAIPRWLELWHESPWYLKLITRPIVIFGRLHGLDGIRDGLCGRLLHRPFCWLVGLKHTICTNIPSGMNDYCMWTIEERLDAWEEVEDVIRRYLDGERKQSELVAAQRRLGAVRSKIRSLVEMQE